MLDASGTKPNSNNNGFTMSHQPHKDINISRQSTEKRELADTLQNDVDAFVARGGKIKELPPQVSYGKKWSYAGVKRLSDNRVA